MTTASGTTSPVTTTPLRNLYFSRAGFAIVWAGLLAVTASSLDSISDVNALTVILLVLYPLVDAAAAGYDLRSSRGVRPSPALYANLALSLLAAVGLAIAVSDDLASVLRVWGAWAIVAGLMQLVVALSRRGVGGQWPQILSGGISVLAGGSFVAQADTDSASLSSIAGYAVLGGIFFLVSAIRLHRNAQATR
jgi:uncharacterized membrane protein HdeD (DUF308 family)